MTAASEAAQANEKGSTLLGLSLAYVRSSSSETWILYAKIVGVSLVLSSVPVSFSFGAKSKSRQTKVPSVSSAGPSGAGKTALFMKWQENPETLVDAPTVTSVRPNTDKSKFAPTFTLVDTPGHEKLAQYTRHESSDGDIKAVVFVLDAASGADEIKRAARPLMAVSEAAEKRGFPVLVAANKIDSFNSSSVNKIRSLLETEIDESRSSSAKNVQSSENSDDSWQQDEFLGVDGKKFEFADSMSEVTVSSGSVQTDRLDKWDEWLEEHL